MISNQPETNILPIAGVDSTQINSNPDSAIVCEPRSEIKVVVVETADGDGGIRGDGSRHCSLSSSSCCSSLTHTPNALQGSFTFSDDSGASSHRVTLNIDFRIAQPDEVAEITEWRHREFGYRAHVEYLRDLWRNYPDGWIVAVDGADMVVGTIFAQILDDRLAFGGMYAVKKTYQCRGIGRELWERRYAFVGTRNLGVNAVKSRVVPNIKLGLKVAFEIGRYFGTIAPSVVMTRLTTAAETCSKDQDVDVWKLDSYASEGDKSKAPLPRLSLVPETVDYMSLGSMNPSLTHAEFVDAVVRYDTHVNTVGRTDFLTSTLLKRDHAVTCAAFEIRDSKLEIVGYGMLRPRYVGFTIGPLYADTPTVARKLMSQLIQSLPDKSTLLDMTVLDDEGNNLPLEVIEASDAVEIVGGPTGERYRTSHDLVAQLGLSLETVLYRMYRHGEVGILKNKIYAFMSSEAFLA